MPSLGQLISARRKELRWTYDRLAEESDGALSKQRWQQLGTDTRVNEFPEPRTLQLIADTIGVGVDRVILATAVTLGVDIPDDRARFATLLPPNADDLSDEQRDAVIAVIRSMRVDPAVGSGGLIHAANRFIGGEPDAESENDGLPTAARTAPKGYVSPGRAIRDAQDQVGEENQDQGE